MTSISEGGSGNRCEGIQWLLLTGVRKTPKVICVWTEGMLCSIIVMRLQTHRKDICSCFETGSNYAAHPGIELRSIHQPQPSECWITAVYCHTQLEKVLEARFWQWHQTKGSIQVRARNSFIFLAPLCRKNHSRCHLLVSWNAGATQPIPLSLCSSSPALWLWSVLFCNVDMERGCTRRPSFVWDGCVFLMTMSKLTFCLHSAVQWVLHDRSHPVCWPLAFLSLQSWGPACGRWVSWNSPRTHLLPSRGY